MEKKKNSKFDLETKRGMFFFYGLVISLTLVLLAFKSGSEVKEIYVPEPSNEVVIDVINIPSTSEPEQLIAPPPLLKLFDKITIVENTYNGPDFNIEIDEIDDPLPLPLPEDVPEVEDKPLVYAQFMPEFPGGMKNLNKWLSNNMVYPEKAQEMGLKGRVYLNFIVGKDGSISDVKVTRSVDRLLDAEAVRVIKTMPKWKPGMQNERLVSVSYNIYVTFQLN